MTDDDSAEREGSANRRHVLRSAAAVGLAGGGLAEMADPASAQSDQREIILRAAESGTVEYSFRVTGTVEPGPTADDRDAVLGGTAVRGEVFDGREDSFLFTGELLNLRLDGPGRAFVDGELVRDTTADLPNEVVVRAGEQAVAYTFRVDGQVEKGGRTESRDEVLDGKTVRGSVGAGNVDTYRYSGSITFEETDAPLTVELRLGGAE